MLQIFWNFFSSKYKTGTNEKFRISAELFNDYKNFPNKKLSAVNAPKRQKNRKQRKKITKVRDTVRDSMTQIHCFLLRHAPVSSKDIEAVFFAVLCILQAMISLIEYL